MSSDGSIILREKGVPGSGIFSCMFVCDLDRFAAACAMSECGERLGVLLWPSKPVEVESLCGFEHPGGIASSVGKFRTWGGNRLRRL